MSSLQVPVRQSAGSTRWNALRHHTAVEYVNNELVVIETPVVTNFYLAQGEKYGIGTEQSHTRYDMLMERLGEQAEQPVRNMEDMTDAMSSVSKNNFGEFASTEWTITMKTTTRF